MDILLNDVIWIMFIVLANILFYIRKGILANKGYKMSFLDLEFKDSQKLSDIVKKEQNTIRIFIYKVVNLGIKIFFFLGVTLFVLSILSGRI